jgi:hypothetical protein
MQLKQQQNETALQQMVLQQSATVLPELEALNPTDDDYDQKLLTVFKSNPYAHQHPGVQNILKLQGDSRKMYLDTKEQADEHARREAEKTRMTSESIRGNVSQLGADYLGLYDESLKSGLDPISANARVASRAESNKIKQQLIQAGLTDEDIAPLQTQSGEIDLSKAQQALSSMIPKEAFTAASRIVDDIDGRISSQKITVDELPPEELEQYQEAKKMQLEYIRQLNQRGKPSSPSTESAATTPVKRVVIRGGAIVK